MTTKKRDDELTITLIVCGVFSLALLIILLTAGNIGAMSFLLRILAFGATGLCALSWVILLKQFHDPNFDYWRKLCIAFALIAIIVIMGHRAGWLGDKQFQTDVDGAKTEQPAP